MKMLEGLRRQRPMLARDIKRAGASKSPRGSTRSISGRIRSLQSGEEGQAIVETTVCLVFIVLPLVFGLFMFGLYIAYYQDLTQAVGAAGVRVGSDRGVSSDPCADALATIQGTSPLNLTASNLTLTVTYAQPGSSSFTTLGGNSCPGNANSILGTTYGGTAVVSATYIVPCPVPFAKFVCQPVGAQVTEYVY